MSKLQRKIQVARKRGVYVFKSETSGLWNVFVEAESILGPRELNWTKRSAVNLAHAITIAKKTKLTITYN